MQSAAWGFSELFVKGGWGEGGGSSAPPALERAIAGCGELRRAGKGTRAEGPTGLFGRPLGPHSVQPGPAAPSHAVGTPLPGLEASGAAALIA